MPPPDAEDPIHPRLPPLGPLPSGRHRFSAEQVAHHQRERLIAGLAAAVAERGYAAVTIGEVAAAAHVSRRVFYEHFESKEACFLAAFDVIVVHVRSLTAAAAAEHPGDWPRQTVARARVALAFCLEETDLARLCLVESLSAGPMVIERYRRMIAEIASVLEDGRPRRSEAHPLSEATEDALMGAIASRVARELALGGPERLPELLPDLVEFVLSPYMGAEEARRYAAEARS